MKPINGTRCGGQNPRGDLRNDRPVTGLYEVSFFYVPVAEVVTDVNVDGNGSGLAYRPLDDALTNVVEPRRQRIPRGKS